MYALSIKWKEKFEAIIILVNPSFSLISGCGCTWIIGAHSASIPLYFIRLRSIALALTHLGISVGMLISPYFMKELLNEYMYTGTCMITAGVCLQACVCGALLRPVEKVSKDLVSTETTQLSQDQIKTISYISQQTECGNRNVGFQDDNQSPVMQNISDDISPKDANSIEDDPSRKVNIRTSCAILGNPTFILCGLTIFGFASLLSTFESLGYSLANEREISGDDIALFLAVMNVGDIVCRPIIGIVLDIPRVKPFRKYLYAVITILFGLPMGLMYFANSLPVFVVLGLLAYSVKGTIIAQRAGLMIDLFGMKNMLPALGLLYVWFGIGMLVGPLIAGKWYTILSIFMQFYQLLVETYFNMQECITYTAFMFK